MEFFSAPLSGSTEVFLHSALKRAAEKSSWVLHDKAIQKAVIMDKGQRKPVKNLQFSQSDHRRRSSKCSDSQLSRTLSGKGSSSAGSKVIFLFQ